MADTIFALATPPGRSGVAVLRISGPAALGAASALGAVRLRPRRAALRRLTDPRDGAVLDQALAIRFDAPASFTGETVVELQTHGSIAVLRGLAAALATMPGLRPAEAGEFTRRALLNGRLDLAQAEGLGDLLAAETAIQARQATALLEGALSRRAELWRATLIRVSALLESAIDFAEEDVPPDASAQAGRLLDDLVAEFDRELAGVAVSERTRIGFEVALVGRPNVGKSTLLNAIAGRDAALVSEVAGTTRDVIEVRLDLAGLAVTLADMAGMRHAADPIEQLGVDRARARADAADLRVFLVTDEDEAAALGVEPRPGDIVALAKADLRDDRDARGVSGVSGDGVPELLERVAATLSDRAAGAGLLNRERHRVALERARTSARAARAALGSGAAEIAAAELAAALRALDFLIGKVDVEAVLDEVFRSFCIGK